MRWRTCSPILLALVLQGSAAITAGCSSRTGSPIRVDEDVCAAGLWRDLAACPDAAAAHDRLARDIVAFAAQADRLAATRERLIAVAERASATARDGQPVPGGDVEALNLAFAELSAAAHAVAEVAARHDPWRGADAAACADSHAPALPLELRVEGAALSAAAGLAIYDTWLRCRSVLAAEPAVRKILNRGDVALGVGTGQVDGVSRDYLDLARRYRVHASLRFLRGNEALWHASEETHLAWLREQIQASPSLRVLRSTWLVPVGEFSGEVTHLVESDFRTLGAEAMGRTSKGFGNAVGAVAFRRGLLYASPAAEAAIRPQLRSGDILLEKTPFRLTDRFIPGHWGHVAIWLGDEAELRALGVWDDPLVQAQAARIRSGALVVEALRDGVQLNPLARFLDIDDICVLRQDGLDAAARAGVVRRALRQVGKEYDFNFDVETADRIVCSELAYQVYTGIAWPTGRALGRATISPDQVALRAIGDGPLTVIDLWHDGARVGGDQRAALTALVKP